MALTLAEANRIVAGTIAKAEELNIKVNVAVCDAGAAGWWRLTVWTGQFGPGSTAPRGKPWPPRDLGGPAGSFRIGPTSRRRAA